MYDVFRSPEDPFNDWGEGGGDEPTFSPFWEETARK